MSIYRLKFYFFSHLQKGEVLLSMCWFQRRNIFWLKVYHGSIKLVHRNVLTFTVAETLPAQIR